MGARRHPLELSLFTALIVGGSLALGHGSPSPVDRPESPRTRCTADIAFPLEVRLVPLSPPHPGAALRVRVEVEASIPMDGVQIEVMAPPEVPVLAGRRAVLGDVGPGTGRSHEFTLILPGDRVRRSVEVVARATQDGSELRRGAVLYLNFDDEASRVVDGPNGQKVREVPARRVD